MLHAAGEEREPRDGHYSYLAEKPFSLIRPLAAQNQAKVTAYLEEARGRLPRPHLAMAPT